MRGGSLVVNAWMDGWVGVWASGRVDEAGVSSWWSLYQRILLQWCGWSSASKQLIYFASVLRDGVPGTPSFRFCAHFLDRYDRGVEAFCRLLVSLVAVGSGVDDLR